MARMTKVEARSDYKLYVEFDDGTSGEISLASSLWGPVFEPLKNTQMFAQVKLDNYGAPFWPCGVDVAPDAIYNTLKRR
ncbi:MAG: DUF2442 domain-containing protein [Deltaproteobacteria bacterium]|nr:DUF2442 domain-containing protein [Deltaproteobacteria bacterium]